jgi:hypothetical protein
MCVGASIAQPQDIIASFSSWRNLAAQPDREEPDIVGLGQNIETLSIADYPLTWKWVFRDGTSYANPLVTSLSALLKEQCGGNLPEPQWRAIIRTSGYNRNPDGVIGGYRYATPGVAPDQRDGSGGISAEAVWPWCRGMGGHDTGFFNVPLGGDPIQERIHNTPPPGPPPFSPTSPPTSPIQGVGGDGRISLRGNHGSPRRGSDFWSGALGAGDRLVATLSWDSCPLGQTGAAPASVAVDFDLFLCRDGDEFCFYSSQSFFDTNEGFDVHVPTAGTWRLYYMYTDSMGCNGQPDESFGWAVRYGQF